jgi:hypothetical protein
MNANLSLSQGTSADALTLFDQWLTRYLTNPQTSELDEGKKLARERRPVFRQLIQSDPRAALAQAVPMVARQKLPRELVALLEERVNATGDLELRLGLPESGVASNANMVRQRVASFANGRAYNAYVFGRREEMTSIASASLNGVAVDSELALSEEPSRRLEVGEIPPLGKEAVVDCPVSGKQVFESAQEVVEVITEETPAVETGGKVVFFCDGGHITSYNDTLILGEGPTGGAFGYTGVLPNAPTPSLGVIKVLAIPVAYPDLPRAPATEATLQTTLRQVAEHYSRASYGRLTLVGVVTPLVKLPQNEAWYTQRDTSNGGDIGGSSLLHLHAREEARKLGYDTNEYDNICVRHDAGPGSYGGLATVPGSTVWLRTDDAGTWAHEIAHSFGLLHANFWDTAGTSSIGPGGNDEYGHSYDIVGSSGSFPNGHYNVAGKNQIRWLPDANIETVTTSGLYRIYAHDTGVLDPARRYGLRLLKDPLRTYWGEVRSLYDTLPWVKNGLMLGWRYPTAGGQNLQLIDTTPGSPFLKEDAPVALGSTFSDREAGQHLTTVAMNESPRYVDVQVNLGTFSSNQRPTLSLAASQTAVPVNGTVTFTATAADADNDTLAYSWQHFGNTSVKIVSPNSPVITRQFTSAGTYVVTCTVSDMKGGTTSRNQLITVGNGNGRFTIRGRVTLGGQGLQDVVVTANGTNGVLTDAAGEYVIPNLSATTYVLSALLYGYSFDELFNNPVTVGPSAANADFRAVAQPVVTISSVTAEANELAPVTKGLYRLTRVGDTSASLMVNVVPASGVATKDTDYSLTPNYVTGSNGMSTFTIPAGSATLDVTLTPLVDTTQEGPETATLLLGPGQGYVVAQPSAATVVINDDDTTLPKVSLSATTNRTLEGAGTPVALTVTRSGPAVAMAPELVVAYTVGGTATAGADYSELSGTVTLPAGVASANILVTPQNDATSEELEMVRVDLAAGTTYLRDPVAANATAQITIDDDDQQTVTLTVTDATAQERDLSVAGTQADTGSFVITRSGDVSAPLTVYYAFSGNQATGVMALHGIDFEALPGSVTIPAGQTQASVTVIPRNDMLGEGPEQAMMHLGAAATNYRVSGASSAVVEILDRAADLPFVDVAVQGTATEGGSSTFRLTLRGGSGTSAINVAYTLTGSATSADYTLSGSGNTTTGASVTLANGAIVTKDITINATNDPDSEDMETVVLTLTPNTSFQTYGPSTVATMQIRDTNNANTVFVSAQAGTGGGTTASESSPPSPLRFWVVRTGSTTNALTVNYTLGGTATAGSDFTALPGSVTIAAGSASANVDVALINDTEVEGTETLVLNLAGGSYSSSGQGALFYILDNEVPTLSVSFDQPSSAGQESATEPVIPVSISGSPAVPVTVEYRAGSNATTGTSVSAAPHVLPYWVRVVKAGTNVSYFEGNDGVNWTQRGTTVALANLGNSYLAGIAAASGSTTAAAMMVDNFSITGLSVGGSVSAQTAVNLGNASPAGTHTLTAGSYDINTPGNGVAASSTADNFRFIYQPVTSSADCTVTARIVSLGTTAASARVGVMLRSSTAQGSVYAASLANGASTSLFFPMNRATTNASSNNSTGLATPVLPLWFRLTRSDNSFTTEQSKDGMTWAAIGTAQILAPGAELLAGLAVSAASDGTVATAIFDNVALNGSQATGLLGRTLGFTDVGGSESGVAGVWTVNGSGAGIANGGDEGHLAALPVSGNFSMTARLTSLTGGGTAAQAGVMARQTRDGYSRHVHVGFVKSGSLEGRSRLQTVTSAYGAGIDFSLASGTLTFLPGGATTLNLPLTIIDDQVDEPDNVVTLQLLNAGGAVLGANAWHGYTIVDNDGPPGLPVVSFAAATSTQVESAGGGEIAVSLSRISSTVTSVDYTVTGGTATAEGGDFTLSSGTLNFLPGETVEIIPLTLTNDSAVEVAETVVVSLTNGVGLQLGSLNQHTLTITDDDLPVVTLTAPDASAAESGDPASFLLTRAGGDITAPLIVAVTLSGTATFGVDTAAIATTYTLPANEMSLAIPVIATNDTANEGMETLIMTLAAGSYVIGTPSTATVGVLDDDRSIVSISANDSVASETPGNVGQFTVTRTAPFTSALTVTLAISGNATNTTDYSTISTTLSFAANETFRTVNVTPVNDSVIEADEVVTVSIASGSGYDIGTPFSASVSLMDNDQAPSLYISSPGLQSTLVNAANGIILQAVISDDGLPSAVTQTWTQLTGPAPALLETPAAPTTAVVFSQSGSYTFRITATDGAFSVSDEVTVVVGDGLTAADWITQDLGPSVSRRGQTVTYNGLMTVTGTGAGFGNGASNVNSDQGHVATRQAAGDGSIVTRLTAMSLSTGLAGVTIRDSMLRGSRRAVLGYVPGTGLQFRARTTVASNDALVASQAAGLSLPLWLRLERVASTNAIAAYYALDVSGAPGAWTQLGATTTVTMDTQAHFGFAATSHSGSTSATAVFDNATLTPAPTGPALLSEDASNSPAAGGSGSLATGVYTIVGPTTGYYHGWQYAGDMVVTARLTGYSSGAGSSIGGLRLAESMESAGYVHLGRIPTSAYDGFIWQALAGGSVAGLPSSVSSGNWIRIVRKSSQVTAFRATHNGTTGLPNAWTQIGQPQTVVMTTPVFVGFFVNNSTGVGTNTCTFTNLTIEALNKAPVVGIANTATWPVNPIALDGSISDDTYPVPVSLSSNWSKVTGPGSVTFADSAQMDTTATLGQHGAYTLRLSADDTLARSFRDLSFTGYMNAFQVWQGQNWSATGGPSDPNADQLVDADADGQLNLLEYAFGSAPQAGNNSPVVFSKADVSNQQFLRMTIPKNPAATDVSFIVEATSDMANPASWSTVGLVEEVNTSTQLVVRDGIAVAPGMRRFMRVRVLRL